MYRTTIFALTSALFVSGPSFAAENGAKGAPDFVAGQEIPLSLVKPRAGRTLTTPPLRVAEPSENAKSSAGISSTESVTKKNQAASQFIAGSEINSSRLKEKRQGSAHEKAQAMDIRVPMQREETYGTVSFYSEYYDHVVRWPDGSVAIYDNTGFTQWGTVLERLQPFMGKVTLKMARDEASADIVIDAVENMPSPHEQSCGVTQNYVGKDNASITKARTKMRRIPLCIGDGKELHLYMHELGHALGFARHSKDDDLMAAYVEKEKIIRIPTLSRFLTGMYGLELGSAFPTKEFYTRVDAPTAWSVSDGSIQPETDTVRADQKVVVVDEIATKKVKSAPSEVSRIKDEPVVDYRPLVTAVGSTLRKVEIIGPDGVQTIWVADAPQEPRATTAGRRK